MIIKRWDTTLNSGAGGWAEHYPKTTSTMLFDVDGSTNIFDANNKIKESYMPDSTFDGMIFLCSIGSGLQLPAEYALYEHFTSGQDLYNRNMRGGYFIASVDIASLTETTKLTKVVGATTYYYCALFDEGVLEENVTPSGQMSVESGDWIIITKVSGLGTDLSPYMIYFRIINNTYSVATTLKHGVVKLGSDTVQSATSANIGTTNGRTYLIQANASGQLVVNVPWVDTNTLYGTATNSTAGLIKVSSTANEQTLQTVTTTSNRQYAVQVDSNGIASVNVPWTDTSSLSQEQVEDYVGAMFTGNTLSGLTTTYNDSTGKINVSLDQLVKISTVEPAHVANFLWFDIN